MMNWKFDRTVTISLIISGMVTTMTIVWFLVNQDKRTTVVESSVAQHILAQREVDARQDAERTEIRKQQREDYKEINNKLDKIMERLSK